jgi:hypothetical protein
MEKLLVFNSYVLGLKLECKQLINWRALQKNIKTPTPAGLTTPAREETPDPPE